MKRLLLLALLLCSTSAQAQNVVCPTRPPGDNSNACASDQFVQQAISGGGVGTFTPGQVLGNGTGSTTVPVPTQLPPIIDQSIGLTRGSVLERGAAGWAIVTPGTSALPWVSNGPGADPAYQALTGSGIASGTVANSNLANMAAHTVKCRDATAGGAPQDCSYPTINVIDYGAVADDSTDNCTPFTNAYNAAVAQGGGTIYIPQGVYDASCFPTITVNSINVRGEGSFGAAGAGATILRDTNTTVNFMTITAQHNTISDIYFFPKVRKTAGYQVAVGLPGFDVLLWRIRIDFAWNGISIVDSSGTRIENARLRFLLGTNGIFYGGSNGNGSFGAIVEHVYADNPYPVSAPTPSSVKTWAISTSFASGNVINNNGRLYQETAASCTSLGSGTGPNGLPAGSTPDTAFTNTISDGTCTWKFVANNSLIWIQNDSFSNSLTAINNELIDGASCFQMTDSANTGASFPQFFSSFDLECDHNFTDSVNLSAGNSAMFANPWLGSNLTGNGLQVGTNHKGEVQIVNARILGNNGNGILFQNGPVNNMVTNSLIENNSVGTAAGTNHGIAFAGNASHAIIKGNRIGASFSGGNNQGWGIIINAGTSDFIVAIGNDVQGNVTGGVVNAGTGTHNVIRDNPGFNPVGCSAAATLGASPTTITAGATPETHYYKQTATNTATITENGQQIAALVNATTYYTIDLGPNESTVTTWVTTAPTVTKCIH